jgi:hypothetical protein
MLVEISPGELIDKLTILQIKADRISDPDKLKHIQVELDVITAQALPLQGIAEITELSQRLKRTNETLWDIENAIRACENDKDFGTRFIELARLVYKNNNQRATLKRRINTLLGSRFVEEKSYEID